jgi:REP element-mobilizing transposase RayT
MDYFVRQQSIFIALRTVMLLKTGYYNRRFFSFLQTVSCGQVKPVKGFNVDNPLQAECSLSLKTLSKQFLGIHLWGRGYFAATSGNVTDDVIIEYINQNSLFFTLLISYNQKAVSFLGIAN